ncbi:hypothetical protein [Methylocystis iwaonis]|uniref:Uncharacterized protein n=1 Tax=Methylocystis iwaonis TaxID=2885079 RepID=A0ABM8EA84_9HYPH|nr:hypothetical protein [Methylocystis iwaonis]BDV34898.1 hypothetical protein SS37A_24270 [Methylocystis iwaonis]
MLNSAMLRRLFIALAALSITAFAAGDILAPAAAAVFPSCTGEE